VSPPSPPSSLVDATTLGRLDRPALARAMRPLWEDAGPLVDRLVGVEVTTWEDHVRRAEAEIAGMDEATRAALLGAHPRIGADPGALAALSPQSWAEQGGDAATDADALSTLEARNDEYEARFGFPFVEWVAGRSKAEMIPVIEVRLKHERADELEAGCAALVAIARDRLARIRSEP
jgi:2-oxo-4-hydroxy-4-carboxy--5-ureidoimidazoline (OHCU) decarboxylase